MKFSNKARIEMLSTDIYVGQRRRPLREETIVALMSSIRELGIQSPLSVRFIPGSVQMDGEEFTDVYELIAGAHRLEAAKQLGMEEVPCLVLSADDNEAMLWEIDENLARAELSTDEMREHLRRRKEIWGRLQEERGKPLPTFQKAIPRQTGFAAETAAATGLTKRRINQLLAEPKPRPQRIAEPVIAPAPHGDVETIERAAPGQLERTNLVQFAMRWIERALTKAREHKPALSQDIILTALNEVYRDIQDQDAGS